LLIRNFDDNRTPFGADADSMNRHLLMGTVIEKNVRQQIEPLSSRIRFIKPSKGARISARRSGVSAL
jgi:hypothetical protein